MKNKQLKIGALLSYIAIIFNIIAGLIYTPWMIKTIGDENYALYVLSLSIINVFLMDFGISSAVTKFLSNYYAKGLTREAEYFLGIVYKVFIAISIIIAIALGFFYFFIENIYLALSQAELNTLKNLFIIVSVYSVVSFPFTTFNGILMANERFIELKACNLGQKIMTVILIVVCLCMGYNVYSLVVVNAFSNVAFLFAKYYFIKSKTGQKVKFKYKDKKMAYDLFGYSSWITVMNLAHRCIFNIMPTIIASIVGAAEITIFSLAATLEGYIFVFADAINGMFMPKISRILVSDDNNHKLTELMIKVGKYHIITIGIIYILFVLIGRQFVYLWMGVGYEMVYLCAVLLILPSLLYVPQQVGRTALLVKDYVKEQALVYVVMAVLNIVLSLILLKLIGIIGAAISVCVAYLIRTAGMNYLYYKKLKVDLREYFSKVYLKWFTVSLIMFIVGSLINKFINISGWISLLTYCLLISIIYIIGLCIFVLDKEEKQNIYVLIRKNN